jgi:hydroxymethylbilane synthase
LELNAGLEVVEIRGNVATRLRKVAEQSELDATLLAAAGLHRLHYQFTEDGFLEGEDVPAGLRASTISAGDMLPCVGQAAIGIEVREGDERMARVCCALNDEVTFRSVIAERAFLRAMGGGCQSPVGAHAVVEGGRLRVQAVSFTQGPPRRAAVEGDPLDGDVLGRSLAAQLR